MNLVTKIVVALAISTSAVSSWTQTVAPASTSGDFAPFQQWMGAVLTGDAATLKSLYSTDPAVKVRVKGVMGDADADTSFWLGLKPRSMTVDVVRNESRHGHISFIFRSTVVSGSGQSLTLTDDQSWQQQGDQWRLIYVERTDAPALKQPSNMKKDIYPANVDAHTEIKEAKEKAAREHKRLLLVFGANWCFDCHVLDLAFHGLELSPIVDANYEVVHVDLGPDGQKNADLVAQYEIPLNKGVPAMAVVDSDGKLIFTQKNGEVEDARGMTPAALADFLNKWKPNPTN
jgi:thioredoxin 1